MNVLNRLVECFPLKAYMNGHIDHRYSISPRHDMNDLCSWEDRTLKETRWVSSSEHFTSVIICSPSCCSKPVWLFSFSVEHKRNVFLKMKVDGDQGLSKKDNYNLFTLWRKSHMGFKRYMSVSLTELKFLRWNITSKLLMALISTQDQSPSGLTHLFTWQ